VTSTVDPLLELAAAHHPIRLIGAGMLANVIGYVDADGSYREPVPTHYCEHAALVLLQAPELWDEQLITGPGFPVADWAAAASTSFVAEARRVAAPLTDGRKRVFDDPHARLSAQQWYWYDPVLLEAEVKRIQPLLGFAADDIAELTGAQLPELLAVLNACSYINPSWAVEVLGTTEASPSSEAGVMELRGRVASQGTTIAPGCRAPNVRWWQLAAVANVQLEALHAFMRLFAITPGDIDPAEPYVHRLWRLRERPVVIWNGRVTLPAGYNLPAGFRVRIERELRARRPKSFERYANQRGRWIETRARALLETALRPDALWRSLRIGTDRSDAAERDGLLLIDNMALALEVKGGRLPPSARDGQESAQRRALERLLRDAAAQAESLASAVRARQPITGVDRDGQRRPVTLAGISRLLPVVITLEDVSGATSRAEPLSKLFPPEGAWQVAIDELDWYARALELPAQLLHYAFMRPRLERTSVAVLDEGDWFRLYHALGPAGCVQYLDALERLGGQRIVHGGDVRRGYFSDGLPVWRSPLHELLRSWDETRPDGWLEASFALLSLSDSQAWDLPELLAESRRRGVPGKMPMLTIRPDADVGAAVHIFQTARDMWPLDASSVCTVAKRTVPDASRHVVLATASACTADLVVGPSFATAEH
jgi:hypothetical protein